MTHLSILDGRTKDWLTRKKFWIDRHGIQSELGRLTTKSKAGGIDNEKYISVFDPVLAELFYKWYTPHGGSILDPFAGGSVRGIVADTLGYKYTGIDLSKEQVEANRLQSSGPTWIQGDSQQVLEDLEGTFDFAFTCPPYFDLEIYSDDVNDLSNMGWDGFRAKYELIMHRTYRKLKDNRFMAIVVSEIRNSTSENSHQPGIYRNLVGETIRAAQSAGFDYYNDYVLIQPFHRGAGRTKRQFEINRKVPRVHQNILVFCKGNPDLATMDIDGVSGIACSIDGIDYRTYKEAGIAHGILASRVRDRCENPRPRWEGWIGHQPLPNGRVSNKS